MHPMRVGLTALCLLGCSKDSPDPIALEVCGTGADPLLTLVLPAERVVADGETVSLLTLRIPRATVGPRKVTVATTSGTFAAAEVAADQCGAAIAALRSSRVPGNAYISASYAGLARVLDTLQFVRAWPQQILLSPDLPNNSATAPVTIQVRLLRTVGLVSGGVLVNLAATTLDGGWVGPIQPAVLFVDSTGLGTAKFAVSDTLFRGSVRVTATVDTVGGTVSGTTTFVIVK